MKKNERFINLRIFLFLAISICLGIGVGWLFAVGKKEIAITMFAVVSLLSILIFILTAKFSNYKTYLIIIAILFAIFCSFTLVVNSKVNKYQNSDIIEKEYTVKGKICGMEEYDGKTIYILKKLTFEDSKDFQSKYRIKVQVFGERKLNIGNEIKFNAVVFNEYVMRENRPNFNALSDNVKFSATIMDEEDIVVLSDKTSLTGKGYNLISNTLSRGLDGDEYSVALALLTGNSNLMDNSLLSSFRYSGVAHIFAVSGLHIGIFSMALFAIAKLFLKAYADRISPLIVVFLIFYAGICGFSPSSIRAVIMFSMMSLSVFRARKYDQINSISIACILTLLINPFDMFTAGFVLSYATAFSIIVMGGFFNNKLKRLPNKIRSSLSVSLSAFIGGAPFVIMFFGYVSPLSLLLNLLLLPLVTIVFIMLVISVVFCAIFGLYQYVFAPSKWALNFINNVFYFFNFEEYILRLTPFGVFTVLYYFAIILIGGLLNFKRKVNNLLICVLFSLSFIGAGYNSYVIKNTVTVAVTTSYDTDITVFNYRKETVVVVNNGDTVSLSNLSRALYFLDILDVDLLVVADDNPNLDAVALAMNKVVSVDKMYCYGINEGRDFCHGIPLSYAETDDPFRTKYFTLNYVRNGYGIKISVDDKNFLAYSNLPNSSVGYYYADGRFDMIVAKNYLDELSAFYNSEIVPYETYEKDDVKEVDNKIFEFKP